MCQHQPRCPQWPAPDHRAARIVADQLARKRYWAALEDISMYSLRVKENGMREPHWHPKTAEMGYVAREHGRMRGPGSGYGSGRIRTEPRRRLLGSPGVPAPYRGHRRRRDPLPDLL